MVSTSSGRSNKCIYLASYITCVLCTSISVWMSPRIYVAQLPMIEELVSVRLSRVRVVPLARNHRHVNIFRIGPLSCETYTLSDLVLLATPDLASILLSFFPSCLSVLQISLLAILLIYSRGYIIARNRQNPRSLSMVRACPRETRLHTGSRGQFGTRTLIRLIIIMLKVEIPEVEVSCG